MRVESVRQSKVEFMFHNRLLYIAVQLRVVRDHFFCCCCLRIASISGLMLASISCVPFFGFHPIDLECFATPREFVP